MVDALLDTSGVNNGVLTSSGFSMGASLTSGEAAANVTSDIRFHGESKRQTQHPALRCWNQTYSSCVACRKPSMLTGLRMTAY